MNEIFFLLAILNFVAILLAVQKKNLRTISLGLAFLEIIFVYLGTVLP